MTEIKVLKTFEISEDLWKQIINGFNESFGTNASISDLKNGLCTSNRWGYGFHAIAFDEKGELIGFNTFSPTLYENNINIVVSGSTFVRPAFRKDIFIFHDMVSALRKRCRADGFQVELGVPNSNSREYAFKFLKFQLVGDLNYYILPISITSTLAMKSYKWTDCICKQIIKIHVKVNSLISRLFDNNAKQAKYRLVTDDIFYNTRFKSDIYKVIVQNNIFGYYRICNEDGRRVAYLMDFREKGMRSYKSLVVVIKSILQKETIDSILFVGKLHFKQALMLKTPTKYIPKQLSLTYYILDKTDKDLFNDMKYLSNWDFSLMNFDVR